MLGQIASYGLLKPYEADRHERLALWDFLWAPVFAVSGISGVVFRNLHSMLWWWPLCLPVVAFHGVLMRWAQASSSMHAAVHQTAGRKLALGMKGRRHNPDTLCTFDHRANRKAYLAHRVLVIAFLRSWWAMLNAPAWAPFLHLKSTTESDGDQARFIKLVRAAQRCRRAQHSGRSVRGGLAGR